MIDYLASQFIGWIKRMERFLKMPQAWAIEIEGITSRQRYGIQKIQKRRCNLRLASSEPQS